MSTSRRARHTALAALAALILPASARATPPFAAAARWLPPAFRQHALGGRTRVDALIVRPGGAVTVTSLPLGALDAMRGDAGEVSVGALRHPLLDRSTRAMGAVAVRTQSGLTGRGVAVAVVDTGLDVRHADFRNADGSTRVAWLLDLSRPVRGVHADLESRFGIERDDGQRYGAVYSAQDLDALLAAETRAGAPSPEIPIDEVGHGTFVTSIAAGNGLASGAGSTAGRYVGVAPEATLLVVRASPEGSENFTDAAVVTGAEFVVDRAVAMGMPVALNLSIGSHHGSHDGNSPLERALATLLPRDTPGRAIVVAAGNEGGEAVHARVDLAPRQVGEIPVALPDAPASDLVTIELVYEGEAQVAVRFPNGLTTDAVPMGQSAGFGVGSAQASVANATDDPADTTGETLVPRATVHTAAVIFSGDTQSGAMRVGGTYTVLVSGSGTVHAYVSDPGASRPAAEFTAAVMPDGTMDVPATSPAFIAVGASVTRLDWSVYGGGVGRVSSSAIGLIDEVAHFSSAGPNRVNDPRPDLLAPGAVIVAAMSAQATPEQPLSIFRDPSMTPPRSSLVAEDGVHGVSAGTSAAAPHVTGGVALLLQARPQATQGDLLAAMAGTAHGAVHGGPRWNAMEGWGSVALDAALASLTGASAMDAVDARASEVTVTRDAVAPDEPMTVTVRLLDASGAPVTDAHTVVVTADHGAVTLPVSAVGSGRYTARWRASAMAPGDRATIGATVDGVALAQTRTVSVFRNVPNGDTGVTASGGCAVPRANGRERGRGVLAVSAMAASALAARRKKRAIRARR